MTWFRIDDQAAFHHRFLAAGNAATGVWMRAGAYCMGHLTDGFVPKAIAQQMGKPAEIKALVREELWLEVEGGYQFFRWHEGADGTKRQETREEVEARRRGARERQTKHRQKPASVTPDLPPDDDRHASVTRDSTVATPLQDPTLATHLSQDTSSSTSSSTTPSPSESGRARRAHALPADWKPTDQHRSYAATHRLDIDDEVGRFRDHHAMKGTLGKDWNAGFRTWLQRSVEFRDARQPAPAPPRKKFT